MHHLPFTVSYIHQVKTGKAFLIQTEGDQVTPPGVAYQNVNHVISFGQRVAL